MSLMSEDIKDIKTNNVVNDVVDIDLSAIRKKKFRIDGDSNRILELNTSDMGIAARLNDIYPKLTDLATQYIQDSEDEDEESLADLGTRISEIDTKMRAYMDEIFDADVSRICVPSGSMMDPINGKFRFEHLLEILSGLYENNFDAEVKKMSTRIKKHTDKYTKKK